MFPNSKIENTTEDQFKNSNKNRGYSLPKTGLKNPGDPKPQLPKERNENSFENPVRRLSKFESKNELTCENKKIIL